MSVFCKLERDLNSDKIVEEVRRMRERSKGRCLADGRVRELDGGGQRTTFDFTLGKRRWAFVRLASVLSENAILSESVVVITIQEPTEEGIFFLFLSKLLAFRS